MFTTERIASVFSFGTEAMGLKKKAARRRLFPRKRLLLLGAVARRDALFFRVLRSGGLDHGAHDRLVGLDPVGDHVPLASVPLQELDRAAALVVHAGNLERLHQPDRAELLQAFVVDIQVLDAPADLLAGHRLALAEARLRGADGFRGNDAGDDAARVINGPYARGVFQIALALLVHVLEHVLHHREVGAGQVEGRGDIALRRIAGRDDVLLGSGPPYADDLGARKSDLGRRLQRGRVHYAPAAQDDPVGPDLAHLQPLRLLLVSRVRHGDVRDLEAVLLGLRVEHRDGFFSVGRVVVNVHDLLALELVHPAFLLADELDLGGVLRPVGRDQREDVGEYAPVGGVGAAVAHGDDRDMVRGGLLDERVGDAGGQGMDDRCAGRSLVLGALVAFHAARVVVLGLALLPRELDAVDAAVALVQHGEVIDHAAAEPRAARRIR